MADLAGEVRVGLGLVRQAVEAVEKRCDLSPVQVDLSTYLVGVGAASVLQALKFAGHEIGPEAVVFLQDHQDRSQTVAGRGSR